MLLESNVVPIGGRAFDLLILFVSRPGVILSFVEIMGVVWGGLCVEEANLRVQIGALRKILGQCDLSRRAIETVQLRGYAFILPVRYRAAEAGSIIATSLGRATAPLLLSPIVGREDAIASVVTALEDRRLVTLTGPGGIGKTAVAIAVANHARGAGSTVVFVDLSTVADGEAAILAIADALGVSARTEVLSAICDHMLNCELLLILDTCEHIVEPVARSAEALLSRCAGLRIIATSREVLRAAGEIVNRISSLSFPGEGERIGEADVESFSAVSLFVDRANATNGSAIKPEDLPLVAEICRRLDGIPLALEFAAARVEDLGIHRIVDRLDDRFGMLTRGRRTARPRHRTLSDTFGWGYDLLYNEEKIMLGQLAQFGRIFRLDEVISVGEHLNVDRPVEILNSLYEKSFLILSADRDQMSYRILDTISAYVAKCDAV